MAAELIPLASAADHPDLLKVAVIRDPVRRLVGFYGRFVVPGDRDWCHVDQGKLHSLHGCSFREMIDAIRARVAAGDRLQHHLVPQTDDIPDGMVFDEVIVVERFEHDLERVRRRLGQPPLATRRAHRNPYGVAPAEPAADRPAEWFATHGLPEPHCFVDDAIVETICDIYADDVAWYLAQPGTALLTAGGGSGPSSS